MLTRPQAYRPIPICRTPQNSRRAVGTANFAPTELESDHLETLRSSASAALYADPVVYAGSHATTVLHTEPQCALPYCNRMQLDCLQVAHHVYCSTVCKSPATLTAHPMRTADCRLLAIHASSPYAEPVGCAAVFFRVVAPCHRPPHPDRPMLRYISGRTEVHGRPILSSVAQRCVAYRFANSKFADPNAAGFESKDRRL